MIMFGKSHTINDLILLASASEICTRTNAFFYTSLYPVPRVYTLDNFKTPHFPKLSCKTTELFGPQGRGTCIISGGKYFSVIKL